MENQILNQEREFTLTRVECSQGVFRAEGVAVVDGIQVKSIHYTELWRLSADGWIEIDLSDQQEASITDSIFQDVASQIVQDTMQIF